MVGPFDAAARRSPAAPATPPPHVAWRAATLLLVPLAVLAACRLELEHEGPPIPQPPFDVPGDATGRADTAKLLVFGFSHNDPVQSDPQVYDKLVPDLVMRGWHAGWMQNQPASEYTVDFLGRSHAAGITFMGGLTGSAVFRVDAASDEQYLDWITRDARGRPVEHTEAPVAGMHRASIANPAYRAHLLQKIELQIDLGVDGFDVDEADGAYSGGLAKAWNGDEGFDDYFLADFNRWLMEKYPELDRAGWIRTFGMTADNYVRRDVPYDDLERNFNYREYLLANGFADDPHDPRNPLAGEWGRLPGNRLTLSDSTFVEKATRLYWKELVMAARAYAREAHGKELLITSNGLFPYVDFNELGMYDWNSDDDGAEANYVPVTSDGHLDGAYSLLPVFRKLMVRHQAVAGDVPLVVFIDWPCQMMDDYYALPLSEKKDLWQIYVPEAYAAGVHYAFHLKTSVPDFPSATQSGVIDFMAEYAGFYKAHRDLYLGASPAPERTVDTSVGGVTAAVTEQGERRLVHLVNHNYDRAVIPQGPFTVTLDAAADPARVTLVSPDRETSEDLAFARTGDRLQIAVTGLRYYDVLVIAW